MSLYKIKDSVDLFLSNRKYLVAYFMNSRYRKCFRINQEMIYLLENIDGKTDSETLKDIMCREHSVSPHATETVLDTLLKNKIITEIITDQDVIPHNLYIRYDRQINYFSEFLESEMAGIQAQKRILDSHVFIFGCGAIGGNIAIELAMAGVGEFSLYDYDIVEASDVSRHIFFKEKYIGIKKNIALAEELKLINSEVKIHLYSEAMTPASDIVNILKDCDFVVNTLDEPYIGYTAAKISRVCVKQKIPHFVAGGFDAHLSSTGELIIPYITPCVECYADYFKVTLSGWKPKKHPVQTRYMEIGGLASLSLFSSSYACIEILKCITGLVEMESSYKIRGEFLFHDMSLSYLNIQKNPHCPICGREDQL